MGVQDKERSGQEIQMSNSHKSHTVSLSLYVPYSFKILSRFSAFIQAAVTPLKIAESRSRDNKRWPTS